jgi:hypothetical protein
MKRVNLYNENFKKHLINEMRLLELNNFHFLISKFEDILKDYLVEYIDAEEYEMCAEIQKFLDKSVKSDRKLPKDELFEDAIKVFIRRGVVAKSYLRIDLKIDDIRAEAIISQLVSAGLINENKNPFETDADGKTIPFYNLNVKSTDDLDVFLGKSFNFTIE